MLIFKCREDSKRKRKLQAFFGRDNPLNKKEEDNKWQEQTVEKKNVRRKIKN